MDEWCGWKWMIVVEIGWKPLLCYMHPWCHFVIRHIKHWVTFQMFRCDGNERLGRNLETSPIKSHVSYQLLAAGEEHWEGALLLPHLRLQHLLCVRWQVHWKWARSWEKMGTGDKVRRKSWSEDKNLKARKSEEKIKFTCQIGKKIEHWTISKGGRICF